MSPPSPQQAAAQPLAFTVRSDGGPFDTSWQVVSIDVWYGVGKLPRAQLVISDGSPDTRAFPISGSPTLLPGATLTITAGYGGGSDVLFKGLIVKQALEIDAQGSQLVVDLADAAIKMTLGRKSAVFKQIRDSDLISRLVTAHGLTADVAATAGAHEELVQFHATDWDLMLTRAEANGLLIAVSAGKVTARRPDPGRAPALRVEYGDSLLELQIALDTVDQLAPAQLSSRAWDYTKQDVITAGPAAVRLPDPGDLAAAALARLYAGVTHVEQSGAPLGEGDLAAWSSATLMRSRLAKLRGHVRYRGSALAGVGDTIELAGLGAHFNGALFVGGVHHGIRDNVWITTATFGLSPLPFAATAPRIAAPEAAGLIPPARGLHVGVVKQVATDPGGNFRVLVTLPLVQGGDGVWARLVGFYASKSCGAVFFPEEGDEVVVGFMGDDPRYPVVLGSVYSRTHPPPATPDQHNTQKAIVTAGGLRLGFDDKRKVVAITTPGGHKVELDDETGAITIADSNHNTITLGEGEVAVASAGALKLSARGDISMRAGGDITLEATRDATLQAVEIGLKAQVKLAAEGNFMAELSSPELVVVRGGLVRLN